MQSGGSRRWARTREQTSRLPGIAFSPSFPHSVRGEGELEMPRAGRRRCLPLLSPLFLQTWQPLKDGGLCPFPYTGYTSFRLPSPVPEKGQGPPAAEQVPASSQPQGSHGASCDHRRRRGCGRAPRNSPQSIAVKTHLLAPAGCFIKEEIKIVL